MSTLVTGGAGFIGSYLVRELVERAENVVMFDVSTQAPLIRDIQDKYVLELGDLSNPLDVHNVFSKHDIKDVYHLGSMLADACEKNPVKALKVNVEGTVSLLEAARLNDVDRFVFASSIAVFGKDVQEPVDDDAQKDPLTLYGVAKLTSEYYGLWYARKFGLDFRALRFTWVFGPGRKTGITADLSSKLIEQAAMGKPLKIGNADEKGDWLYVKDAVKALLLVHDAENPTHRVYNISGGVHSIREVMAIVKKTIPDAVIDLESGTRTISPYPSAYKDERARSELGWSPSYTIDEAVKEHIKTIRQREAIG